MLDVWKENFPLIAMGKIEIALISLASCVSAILQITPERREKKRIWELMFRSDFGEIIWDLFLLFD